MVDNSILLELRKNIGKCTNYEFNEIFNVVKEFNMIYTQNKNGIFIDMKQFDQKIIDKLNALLEYFKINNEKEFERSKLLNNIKSKSIII